MTDNEARPLSDPVSAWSAFIYALARILFGLFLASYIISTLREGYSIVGTLLAMVFLGLIWWSLTNVILYPFFAQRGWDQAVFLRTFRRDDLSRHDREIIHAALPPEVKLVGIRDPKLRPSWWIRFVLEGWTALRYLGSDRFELEAADRNWLARLQRTLAESRFAIIDLRDATSHVADEVRLCWKMGNGQRIVFITDESKPQADWLSAVATLADISVEDLEHATFFALPTSPLSLENKRGSAAYLRELLAVIPPGSLPLTGEALTFVQERVKPSDWNTPWIETPAASITIASIFGTVSLSALVIAINEKEGAIVQAIVTGLGGILFVIASARMSISAFRQRRLGRRGGISLARSVLALAVQVPIAYLQTMLPIVMGS